jgi:hypothetical protein
MKLATGGPLGSTQKNLWVISAGATDVLTGQPIPYDQISIGGFGRLDTNGNVYAMLPDNDPADITPSVNGKPYYSFGVGAQEYKLTTVTACDMPTNIHRTIIGIGEQVLCSLTPSINVTWKLIGGGSLSPTNGSSTTLTASLSPTNSTVVLQIGSVTQALPFSVVAPSGIGNVTVYTNLGLGATGTNSIGAQTVFSVIILPTNVSFANVQFREDIPAFIITWPNNTYTPVDARIVPLGAEGQCDAVADDTIQDGPWPIAVLYRGTNYVDFPVYLTWADQYLNASTNWVDFATVQTITTYRGLDQKCQQKYQGIPGAWQGPWAVLPP